MCVPEKLFAFVGVPKVLKTDNGPPFNGKIFRDFMDSYGIVHRKVTPEHPQANGQAESFMKNVGKVIRGAIAEGKDWRHELNMFAMIAVLHTVQPECRLLCFCLERTGQIDCLRL